MEIQTLGKLFVGRLNSDSLADALQNLDFNEWGLALETLAEKLSEEGVAVSPAECDKFDEIGGRMGMPPDRFRFLRTSDG